MPVLNPSSFLVRSNREMGEARASYAETLRADGMKPNEALIVADELVQLQQLWPVSLNFALAVRFGEDPYEIPSEARKGMAAYTYAVNVLPVVHVTPHVFKRGKSKISFTADSPVGINHVGPSGGGKSLSRDWETISNDERLRRVVRHEYAHHMVEVDVRVNSRAEQDLLRALYMDEYMLDKAPNDRDVQAWVKTKKGVYSALHIAIEKFEESVSGDVFTKDMGHVRGFFDSYFSAANKETVAERVVTAACYLRLPKTTEAADELKKMGVECPYLAAASVNPRGTREKLTSRLLAMFAPPVADYLLAADLEAGRVATLNHPMLEGLKSVGLIKDGRVGHQTQKTMLSVVHQHLGLSSNQHFSR